MREYIMVSTILFEGEKKISGYRLVNLSLFTYANKSLLEVRDMLKREDCVIHNLALGENTDVKVVQGSEKIYPTLVIDKYNSYNVINPSTTVLGVTKEGSYIISDALGSIRLCTKNYIVNDNTLKKANNTRVNPHGFTNIKVVNNNIVPKRGKILNLDMFAQIKLTE